MKDELKDFGNAPFVIDIDNVAVGNENFRLALWTGSNLQLTLMSIEPGDDVGLEIHEIEDQFFRVEKGRGRVLMGKTQDNLDFERYIFDDSIICIPAGTWHNIINTGKKPLKLYSIYAPAHHAHGTIHKTKADAEAAELAEQN